VTLTTRCGDATATLRGVAKPKLGLRAISSTPVKQLGRSARQVRPLSNADHYDRATPDWVQQRSTSPRSPFTARCGSCWSHCNVPVMLSEFCTRIVPTV
jgi:hypothetical protein